METRSTTRVEVPRTKLGSQGLEVSKQGLGCMRLSAPPPMPEPEMIKLIHHAINSGVTFLDTSDVYGAGTNEILIGKALKGVAREKVQIASKFGISRKDGKMIIRGDPQYVRACCEASLKRLDIDYIDLYYIHRVDTSIPIEVTMGELKKLVEEGKIKYIGLSEASASTIRRAYVVHPITAIQNEWSLSSRNLEQEIVPTCRELGIGIVTYRPLGGGFFSSGPKLIEKSSEGHSRKGNPRARPENLEDKKTIFDRISDMAARKGCSPAQLALAWLHHQGDDVCPIPGTTKNENLSQNLGAISVNLTPEETSELESYALAAEGSRIASAQATSNNSETPPLSSWKAH